MLLKHLIFVLFNHLTFFPQFQVTNIFLIKCEFIDTVKYECEQKKNPFVKYLERLVYMGVLMLNFKGKGVSSSRGF